MSNKIFATICGDHNKATCNTSATLAVCLILLASISAYILMLGSPIHLDDQFLLNWLLSLKHTSDPTALTKFMTWGGPDVHDAWGPITCLTFWLGSLMSGNDFHLYLLFNIVLHAANAVLVYCLFSKLQSETKLLPLCSALLFALYPLHAESVSWISGRAAELSTFFSISCLYFYVLARQTDKIKQSYLLFSSSMVLLILGLLSCWTLWTVPVAIVLLEGVNQIRSNKIFLPATLKFRAVLVLIASLLTAIILITAKKFFPDIVLQIHPVLQLNSIIHLLHNLFFPINQSIWAHYSDQYRFLYFIYALPLIASIFALGKDNKFRIEVLFFFLWFMVSLLPYIGYASIRSDLYGSRWLYLASIPLSGLIALVFLSLTKISTKYFKVLNALSIIPLALLLFFYFCHLKNQNDAYKVEGKILSNIQKSVKLVSERENSDLIIVRDVPAYVSVVPTLDLPNALLCFDGASGLMRAYCIDGGKLKDILRQHKMLSTILRWDSGFSSLVPLDLNPTKQTFGESVSGKELVQKIYPSISFYKTVTYDPTDSTLVLERNSENGPSIIFKAEGLSPIDGDLFYIDAKINIPKNINNPQAELYWLTNLHQNYDQKERHVKSSTIVNDKEYHRYYFSLRENGWTTNGVITDITVGFPPGAKVALKQIGVIQTHDLVPSLQFTEGKTKSNFDQLLVNYPENSELGLFNLSTEAPSRLLNFSTGNIAGAQSATLEISAINAADEAQGYINQISLPITGNYNINYSEFPKSGIYRIKILAKDKTGKIVGIGSDSLFCLVHRN